MYLLHHIKNFFMHIVMSFPSYRYTLKTLYRDDVDNHPRVKYSETEYDGTKTVTDVSLLQIMNNPDLYSHFNLADRNQLLAFAFESRREFGFCRYHLSKVIFLDQRITVQFVDKLAEFAEPLSFDLHDFVRGDHGVLGNISSHDLQKLFFYYGQLAVVDGKDALYKVKSAYSVNNNVIQLKCLRNENQTQQ